MLQKLFALFKRKPKVTSLYDSELKSWLNQKETEILSPIQEELKNMNSHILDLAKQTKDQLTTLATLETHQQITDREKQFVLVNMETFAKRTLLFLQNLQLLGTLTKADEYFTNYTANLKQFEEMTQRPFHVLQPFFPNQVQTISLNIKEIDMLVNKIGSIVKQERYHTIQQLKTEIKTYEQLLQRKAVLERECYMLAQQEKQLQDSKSGLVQKLEQLRSTIEYQQVSLLKEELQSIIEKMKQRKTELYSLFSELGEGLKRFGKINFSDEYLILKYVQNPLDALTEDSGLRIAILIQNLKLAIEEGNTTIKPEKRILMVQHCDKLSKEYLASFLKEYKLLRSREQELITKIKAIPVMQDISSVKKDLAVFEIPEQELRTKREKFQQDIAGLCIDTLRSELAQRLTPFSLLPIVINEDKILNST